MNERAEAAAAAAADPGPIGRPDDVLLDPNAYKAGLGVYLNGVDTRIITIASYDRARGVLAMPAGDLRQLRIKVDPAIADDTEVDLASIAGLSFTFDEPGQLLQLSIDPALLEVYALAVSQRPALELAKIQQSTGLVLNYDLYGASAGGTENRAFLNANLEGRIFSPLGTLSSTATLSTERLYGRSGNIVRLDTTWRMIDPEAVRAYAIGDVVTASVRWSGSYRMGGLQIQSAFAQRPDIVTTALPQFAGSAALPSTIDLFVNSSKVYSGEVPSGPFMLDQLPQLSGGDVRIVTRDAAGNEKVVKSAYYYSPSLLRGKLFDYSAEIGFLRYGFGQDSFRYRGLAGSLSGRYGLSGNTTIEAHAEAAERFFNLGVGINQRLGGIGILELAGAISRYEGRGGQKVLTQISTLIHGVTAYAGTERRFGDYFDLGRLSVMRNPDLDLSGTDVYVQMLASTLGAKAIDRAGLSAQIPFDRSTNLSIGYTSISSDYSNYRLLNVSASRNLGGGFGLIFNGYRDIEAGDTTLMVGLTRSFGTVSAMASAQRANGATSFDLQASGSSGRRQNAFNWSILDRETQGGDSFRSATLGYRSSQAWLQGSVQQQGSDVRVVGQLNGSLVAMGGELRAVNQVGDSFVLVRNAGPDALIRQDSVLVARTGRSGSAFLPDTMPFRPVTISIDPTNMPIGWQVENTEKRVIAGWRNGAVVDFGARRVRSAIVKIVDPSGKAIEPGYVLRREDGREALIGYGGEAYVEDVASRNAGTVDLGPAGVCRISFDVPEQDVTQPVIGPVPCVASVQ